eukprot:TRINITY_DN95205_c0_g1_i1.p1 TRINITY_DN95205_c0_g1~~TRINITY_DN95205_c0_g1_i1.p1  ORF type:complete len:521 (-),score=65.32 TRINITY_DN95205_c0_g1_i1:18-1559(-)
MPSSAEQPRRAELNPFINATPRRTTAGWLKLIVPGAVLLPLRLILFFGTLIAMISGASISVAGIKEQDRTKPLRGWRTWFGRYIAPFCCRTLLFALGFHRIQVRGKPAQRSSAGIVIGNHSTFTDPLLMNYLSAGCFVANHKIAEYPFLGPVFRALQCIFVNRLDPNSRHNVAEAILQRSTSPEWPRVMLFPEGTCTNNKALISFKAGAFAPGVPVQPVCIRYIFHNLDLSYVQGTTIPALMLRAMCEFYNSVEVTFLPVYIPNAAEKRDPLGFARNVRRRMATAMNIPITEHSYDDVLLQGEAQTKLHMPYNNVVVEMGRLKQLFNLELGEVKELLRKFHEMDRNNDGQIAYDEFVCALGLPPSSFSEGLFELMDENDTGRINFRQFVTGLSFISSKLTEDESLQAAFQIFDKDGDGIVRVDELIPLMRGVFVDMTPDDVKALFSRVDTNRDDRVDFAEFKAFMKKNPEYLQLLDFQQHQDDAHRSSFLKRALLSLEDLAISKGHSHSHKME